MGRMVAVHRGVVECLHQEEVQRVEVWMIFVAIGLVMVLLELVVGVDAGLDLVILGTAFMVGGLVGLPFKSWVVPLIATGGISVVYLAVGRRYVHRWTAVRTSKTNIDAIIGRTGFVVQGIARDAHGRVKVGVEDWRACAAEDIEEGAKVVVTDVNGVTLVVERAKEVST